LFLEVIDPPAISSKGTGTNFKKTMQTPRAYIIGAGIAGLATAIRLACQGWAVEVFEKNGYPGGKLSHFDLEGYQFDAGPSLFTQPQNIEELFNYAGEDIRDYFSYQSLPLACRYFYEDGTVVEGHTQAAALAEELSNKLGENPTKVTDYLAQSAKMYQHIGQIFLNHSLHKLQTLRQAPIAQALRHTKARYLFDSMDGMNRHFFNNPKTVQLFNRFATYNGSNPYQAPAMLCMIPHLEHNEGTFYPHGGMISITNALYRLARKKEVQFHFNQKVDRILLENGQAVGLEVAGEQRFAKTIVSNMDVYFTYLNLLNNASKAKQILKQERSSSAFIFYWGINHWFENLHLHNIFFSGNYEKEFESIFLTKEPYSDPTIYVNITAKCEPGTQAPAGKENWFVMVNAPAHVGQNWDEVREIYRVAILQKLSRILQIDIASLIEVERTLSPAEIESVTSSYMGSLYGTSSNDKMAAFLRHPNFSKDISNLYFVGGSVHPGGGIPLCLKSAQIASDLIYEDIILA
jgi:phytoene desaturase